MAPFFIISVKIYWTKLLEGRRIHWEKKQQSFSILSPKTCRPKHWIGIFSDVKQRGRHIKTLSLFIDLMIDWPWWEQINFLRKNRVTHFVYKDLDLWILRSTDKDTVRSWITQFIPFPGELSNCMHAPQKPYCPHIYTHTDDKQELLGNLSCTQTISLFFWETGRGRWVLCQGLVCYICLWTE